MVLPSSSGGGGIVPTNAVPSPPTQMQVNEELDSEGLGVEARSAKDGAWFDVADFLSHRISQTGDLEVKVKFAGFGPDENEWVDVRKHVRLQSIPCEPSECNALGPGDHVLCFKEDKGQALHFDALVIDAQRHTHDMNECSCTFLVRYEHDQSEEETSLTKICRRPENRLKRLHTSELIKQVDPLKTQSMTMPKQAGINSDVATMIIRQSATQDQSGSRPEFEAYLQTVCASESTDSLLVEDVIDGRGSEGEGGHKATQVNVPMPVAKGASGRDFLPSSSLWRNFLPTSGKDGFPGHFPPGEGNTLHCCAAVGAVDNSGPLHAGPSFCAHDGLMSLSSKYGWVLAKLKAEELKGGPIYPVLPYQSDDRPSLSAHDGSMSLSKYGWVLAKLKAEELKGGTIYPIFPSKNDDTVKTSPSTLEGNDVYGHFPDVPMQNYLISNSEGHGFEKPLTIHEKLSIYSAIRNRQEGQCDFSEVDVSISGESSADFGPNTCLSNDVSNHIADTTTRDIIPTRC